MTSFDGHPTDWFEELYKDADVSGSGVPWSHMTIHPHFERWLADNPLNGRGKKALVVGCGMGDDAIELEKLGFDVTAFDVSPTAIEFCKERFPESKVSFEVEDLFLYPQEWLNAFDFILEIYTIQALPPEYEEVVIDNICGFLKSSGNMLVVAGVREEERSLRNGPPWLLTPEHRQRFMKNGLLVQQSEDIFGPGEDYNHTFITYFMKK